MGELRRRFWRFRRRHNLPARQGRSQNPAPAADATPAPSKRPRWVTTGRWGLDDAFAVQALGALGGNYLPWSPFSMSPKAVMTVVNEAMLYEAAKIVELGAGLSTVFLARYLRQWQVRGGHIITVDDNVDWLNRVRHFLELEQLSSYVDPIYAPLTDWTPDGDSLRMSSERRWEHELPTRWYSGGPISDALDGTKVDLLLVDGPRGRRTISRYPALPVLMESLHDESAVMLDDAHRPPEQEIIARWSALSSFEFRYHDEVKVAIGRRGR
jgi:Methyltransferase domain